MKRLDSIDIAKGIGILLVVWAHASGPFSSYIYQFHMPLFFLISGYLFNDKSTIKNFIVKKIKTLYIPFVFWNLCFTILKACVGIHVYTVGSFAKEAINIILTLNKDDQFLGATWFLGALFVVSVCYKLLDAFLPNEKRKSIVLGIMFGMVATVGFTIPLPYMLSRTLVLSAFFAIGRIIKEYSAEIKPYDTRALVVFALILFVIMGHYNSANMGANKYTYPFLFVIGALLASSCTIAASRFIDKKLKLINKVFKVLGRESISILIWQFLVFRLVIALQLYLDGIPLTHILEYYPCYSTANGWWIVYTIVGVAASMLLGTIIKYIKCGIGKLVVSIRGKALA